MSQRLHRTPLIVVGAIALWAGGCEQPAQDDFAEVVAEVSDADAEKRYDALKSVEESVERGVNEEKIEQSIPALRKALRDPDARVRYRAAKVLAKLESDAAPAVDELRATLKDPDPKTRYYVAKSLAKIGKPAQRAVPELITALDDKDPEVRYFAAKALGRIEAEEAIGALERAAQSNDVKLREAAHEALVDIRD